MPNTPAKSDKNKNQPDLFDDEATDITGDNFRERREVLTAKVGGQTFQFRGSTFQFLVFVSLIIPSMMLCVVLYFLNEHESKTKQRAEAGHALGVEFVNALKGFTSAQKENTCILTLTQEKREAELFSANSFCKQMARQY